MLIRGYEHARATTAETVIAVALLAGLCTAFVQPRATGMVALAAQGFAILGTLAGVLHSRSASAADIVFHLLVVAVLVSGLIVALR